MMAMMMILAMGITTFAATVKIGSKPNDSSEYSAYMLFSATVDEGKSEDESDDRIAYIVNEKYEEILLEVTEESSASYLVDYISSLKAVETRTFADEVYDAIKKAGIDADKETSAQKFELESGYYLIVETSLSDSSDTYSLVMLDTVGNDDITIKTKESAPTLVKKVLETNDSTGTTSDWQDGADYDIGDEVPFKLTGTISSQYANYKTYYYAFHDTLSDGLLLNPDSVVVKVVNGDVETELPKNGAYQLVTESDDVTESAELKDGCTFEIRFNDLKTITDVNKDSIITVEYTAKLTDDATIGSDGNPNEAKLEYCNDPYFTGNEEGSEDGDSSDDGNDEEDKKSTSETPLDKVIVFTYELDVNKIDSDGEKLKGAGFTLYKLVADTNANVDADADGTTPADYVKVGEEIIGKDLTTFVFTGLDAGKYKLEESTVPEGYNKAEDIEFEITADYDIEEANPEFKSLAVKDAEENIVSDGGDSSYLVNEVTGIITTYVVNSTGALLPFTGGIGSVIFYVVGILLMFTAVVLFMKSKRPEYK